VCFNYSVFTLKLQSTCACDLNFIIKDEGLLKATVSRVHWQSGNILEMALEEMMLQQATNRK